MTNNTIFLYDLAELLKKHDAEISVDDHWTGCAECGRDLRISIDFKDSYETVEMKYIDVESLNKLIDSRVNDDA